MYFPHIDTPSGGPLTAADLDAALKHSTGRIFPSGLDQQGRYITRPLPDDCAPEGGEHHEPSRTIRPRPALGVVLVLVTGVPFIAALVGFGMSLAR